MRSSDSSREGAIVAIVSPNQETLDDLDGYLRGVGVETCCSRHLGIVEKFAPSVLVLVVFPDDFLRQKVMAALTVMSECHPRVLVVVVTGEPRRYERLPSVEGILVLPRPIWAWTIHDAIRDHLSVLASRPTTTARRKLQRPP